MRAAVERLTPSPRWALKISNSCAEAREARVPFGTLIALGMIRPGATLYDLCHPEGSSARRRHASPGGEQGSIHKMGARVQDGQPAMADFWHVKRWSCNHRRARDEARSSSVGSALSEQSADHA